MEILMTKDTVTIIILLLIAVNSAIKGNHGWYR